MTLPDIPVLETDRLVLRGPESEDYPDFKATFTSYRARFMGGPLNAYEAWMLYAAEIGHWQIRGFGMWMIHDRVTDETLGMAVGHDLHVSTAKHYSQGPVPITFSWHSP